MFLDIITLGKNVIMFSNGDQNGKPRRMTGWRASCMYLWKNSGPCFLRPSGSASYDSPDSENNIRNCVKKVYENGLRKERINSTTNKCL